MAVTVAEIVAKIRAEGADEFKSTMRQGQQATDNFAQSASKWGESLTKAGKKATLGISVPVAGAVYKMVTGASDLAEATSAASVTYGKASDLIIEKSKGAASVVGLSKTEYLSAATNIGVYGKAAGLVGNDLAKFGDQTIKAGADLASFYNAPVPEALAAIKSGLSGEYESLRKFGILLNADAVQAEALAMGIFNGTGELTEQQKVLARQSLIMKQLGPAQGDFLRTQDGLANQTRILKAELANLSSEMGAALLPTALKLVSGLRSVVTFMRSLSPGVQKLAIVFGLLAAAIGPVLIVVGTLVSSIGAIAPLFAAANVATGASAGIFAGMLGPIALVIGALVLLTVAYKKNFLGFGDGVRYVVRNVVTQLSRLARFVTTVIRSFQQLRAMGFNPISAALLALRYQLSRVDFGPFQKVVDVILGAMVSASNAVKKFVERFSIGANQVTYGLSKILDAFKTDGLGAAIESLFGEGGEIIMRGIGKMLGSFDRAIGDFLRGVTTGFEPLDKVIHGIGDLFVDAGVLIQRAVSGDWGGALESAKRLVTDFKSTFEAIGDLADVALDFVVSGAITLAGDIKDAAGRLVEWVKDKLFGTSGSSQSAKSPLSTPDPILANQIVSGALKLAGEIADAAGNLAGWVKEKLLAGASAVGDIPLPTTQIKGALALAGDLLTASLGFGSWLWNKIKAGWNYTFPFLQSTLKGAIALGDALLTASKDFGGWLWGKIKGAWAGTLQAITAILPGALALGGDMLEASKDLAKFIWEKWFKTGNFFYPVATFHLAAKLGLVDPDKTFLEFVGDIVLGVVGAIGNAANIGSEVAKAISDKIGGFKGWVQFITSDSFDLGNAVGLAIRGAIGKSADVATGVFDGVVDGIKAMKDISAADVVSVGTKIAKGLVLMLALPLVWAGSLITAFASFMGGLITGLVFGEDADFGSVVTKIATGIKGAFQAATDWASGIMTQIAAGLFSTVSSDMFSGLVGAIASAIWNGIKGIVSGWSLTDFLPDWAKGEADTANKDKSKPAEPFTVPSGGYDQLPIIPNIVDIYKNAPAELKAFTNSWSLASKEIKTSNEDVAKTFRETKASVKLAFDGMKTDATTMRQDVANQFVGLRADLTTLSTSIRNSVANVFIGLRADMLTLSTGARQSTSNQFVGLRADLSGIAASTRNAVANAFIGLRSDVTTILASLKTSIVGTWAGLASQAATGGSNIGDALGSGIYYGMAAWVSSIANLAARTVSGAIDAARAEAGNPRSPSPVTRKRVGGPLGEGVYAGVMDWRDKTIDALAGYTDAAAAKAKAGMQDWQALTASGTGGIGSIFDQKPVYTPAPRPQVQLAGTGRQPTGPAPTFVVMTRAELAKMFEAVDFVQVVTTPSEVQAAWGS